MASPMMFLLALVAFMVMLQLMGPHLAKVVEADLSRDRQADPTPRRSRGAALLRRRRGEPALPLLPEGHRPPHGLGPISPSPRAIAAELERGLRRFCHYLDDPANWH